MKYVRTKDGRIAEIKENMVVKVSDDATRLVYKEEPYLCVLNGDDDILKQADTIEELCDEFVVAYEDGARIVYGDLEWAKTKAILMSIRPEWVAKILNGEKTIEIRKKFPSDYVGWVHIYCTKNGEKPYDGLVWDSEGKGLVNSKLFPYAKNCPEHDRLINGKVVARFWCDKVEEIKLNLDARFFTKLMNEEELLKQSCLTSKELENYLWFNICCGYAIHITKLEIFDKPKDISEFHKVGYFKRVNEINIVGNPSFAIDYENAIKQYAITSAPQSWQYIEV